MYTGTTSAVLQSSGTTPVSRDKLYINVRMKAISLCSSLRILGEISSGPEALFGESLVIMYQHLQFIYIYIYIYIAYWVYKYLQ